MVKRLLATVLAIITLLSLAGCKKSESKKTDGKLKIVTTFFAIYDFTREIVGDNAEVYMLFPYGAEPHSYEPTINDVAAINDSDLVIYVGGESDKFVEKIKTKSEVLNLSKVADTYAPSDIAANTGDGFKTHNHDHEHNDKKNFDEHIWLSPKNAKKIVNGILEKLIEIDEINANFYKNNAKKYLSELQKLDDGFENLDKQSEIIIADRFPFGYLLHDYSLNFSAAISGCSSDSEPTVKTMKYLIDTINANNINTVFTIEFSSGNIAKRLFAECGTNNKTLYSMQSISKTDFNNGESYVSLMNKNLKLLKEVE